jgi:hypothetical protein
MGLPVPTLDHVVVNTHDRMDEAAACYERLGFLLTPRGHHTLGSINHLAIFGTDYLELVGVDPAAATNRTDLLNYPVGLNGLVFGTEDAHAVHAALDAAGVPVAAPNAFSRPVALSGGTRDATFWTTRVKPEAAPYGRVYFCQHGTRDLVWRDEWRRHPNGVIGIVRAVIGAADPLAAAALYRTMFGSDAVREIEGGVSLAVGLSRFDIVSPATLAAQFGDGGGEARGDHMAALTFRTVALDRAEQALRAGSVAAARREPGRLIVPASAAFGAILEFVA